MMDTLRQGWQSGTITTSETAVWIAGVLDGFLVAGRADRAIREDVAAMDVVMAVCALLSTAAPDDNRDERARLLLMLFVYGLGARAG